MATQILEPKGTIPRVTARRLPPNNAQIADDCKLWNGEIRPFRGTTLVNIPFHGTSTKAFVRWVEDGVGFFFNWDKLVHTAVGGVKSDSLNRLFYTGDDTPKKTGNDIAIPPGSLGQLPASWYHMGVLAPQLPTTAVQAAGSAAPDTRNYVITYVTGWGEESAPSPPSEIVTEEDATIRITREPGAKDFATSDVSVADDEITEANHAYESLSQVRLTTTTTLPSPLALATTYFIIVVDPSTYKLATTRDNAVAGLAINLNDQGVGTHTTTQIGLDPKYNITAWRIYRTVTGSDGFAPFVFVVEKLLSDLLHDDSALATALNASETLPTLIALPDGTDATFDEPPTDMIGLVEMANGFLAGFSPALKQVCFSHPGAPYAWPERYRRTLNFDPIAVASVGNVLVVGTENKPVAFIGNHPAEMTEDEEGAQQSCLSAQSMVETPLGVLFSSPDGGYLVGRGGAALITEDILSKDDWQALRPETHKAAIHDNRWHVLFDSDGAGANKMLIFDPRRPGDGLIRVNLDAKVIHADSPSDGLFLLVNGQIIQWDVDPGNPRVATWRSKKISERTLVNQAWLQLKGDFSLFSVTGKILSFAEYDILRLAILAFNAAVYSNIQDGPQSFGVPSFGEHSFAGGDHITPLPVLQSAVIVRVYGDEVLRATLSIETEEERRLPDGYLAEEYEYEVETQIAIEEIRAAETIDELRNLG